MSKGGQEKKVTTRVLLRKLKNCSQKLSNHYSGIYYIVKIYKLCHEKICSVSTSGWGIVSLYILVILAKNTKIIFPTWYMLWISATLVLYFFKLL